MNNESAEIAKLPMAFSDVWGSRPNAPAGYSPAGPRGPTSEFVAASIHYNNSCMIGVARGVSLSRENSINNGSKKEGASPRLGVADLKPLQLIAPIGKSSSVENALSPRAEFLRNISFSSLDIKRAIAQGRNSTLKHAVFEANRNQNFTVKLIPLKKAQAKRNISTSNLPSASFPASPSPSPQSKEMFSEKIYQFIKESPHPNIVNIHNFSISETRIILIEEYLPLQHSDLITTILVDGKEGLSRTNSTSSTNSNSSSSSAGNPHKRLYNEAAVHGIISAIVNALSHIHVAGFIYRELNHENVVLYSKDDWTSVKLCGTSGAIHARECYEPYGMILYRAPEQESKKYTNKADMYSLGVLTYLLLSGEIPPSNHSHLFKNAFFWDDISESCKTLLSQLLSPNPSSRPISLQLLAYQWITRKPRSGPELTDSKLKLRKTIKEVMSTDLGGYQKRQSIFSRLFSKKDKEKSSSASSSISDDITIDEDGYHKVCSLLDAASWNKGIHKVKLEGVQIVLILTNDQFYALSNACSHQGSPLDQGDIEDIEGTTCIVCPTHKFKYDLLTGKNVRNSKFRQITYGAKIAPDPVTSLPYLWVLPKPKKSSRPTSPNASEVFKD